MTWEEKLYELLELDSSISEFYSPLEGWSFNTSYSVSSVLLYPSSPHRVAREIETFVKHGELTVVRSKLEKFAPIYKKWKKIMTHLRKNKSCVDFSSHYRNFFWKDGRFKLGSDFAPEGLEGFEKDLLKWSRLVRDAEKRCLKHPRFKKSLRCLLLKPE